MDEDDELLAMAEQLFADDDDDGGGDQGLYAAGGGGGEEEQIAESQEGGGGGGVGGGSVAKQMVGDEGDQDDLFDIDDSAILLAMEHMESQQQQQQKPSTSSSSRPSLVSLGEREEGEDKSKSQFLQGLVRVERGYKEQLREVTAEKTTAFERNLLPRAAAGGRSGCLEIGAVGGNPFPSTTTPSSSSSIVLEKFSGLRVRNPDVIPGIMESYMIGRRYIKLPTIPLEVQKNGEISGDWVTIAVVADKSMAKLTSNGNKFLTWKLTDLEGCMITLLLFGDAYTELWKDQPGRVVALLNPSVLESKDQSSMAARRGISLKISMPTQVLRIGMAADLGKCKSNRKDGNPCGSFVNLRKSEYCEYHIQSEFKKLKSTRPLINSGISRPLLNPKVVQSMSKTSVNNLSAGTFRVGNKQQFVTGDGKVTTAPPPPSRAADKMGGGEKRTIKRGPDYEDEDGNMVVVPAAKALLEQQDLRMLKHSRQGAAMLAALAGIPQKRKEAEGATSKAKIAEKDEAAKKKRIEGGGVVSLEFSDSDDDDDEEADLLISSNNNNSTSLSVKIPTVDANLAGQKRKSTETDEKPKTASGTSAAAIARPAPPPPPPLLPANAKVTPGEQKISASSAPKSLSSSSSQQQPQPQRSQPTSSSSSSASKPPSVSAPPKEIERKSIVLEGETFYEWRENEDRKRYKCLPKDDPNLCFFRGTHWRKGSPASWPKVSIQPSSSSTNSRPSTAPSSSSSSSSSMSRPMTAPSMAGGGGGGVTFRQAVVAVPKKPKSLDPDAKGLSAEIMAKRAEAARKIKESGINPAKMSSSLSSAAAAPKVKAPLQAAKISKELEAELKKQNVVMGSAEAVEIERNMERQKRKKTLESAFGISLNVEQLMSAGSSHASEAGAMLQEQLDKSFALSEKKEKMLSHMESIKEMKVNAFACKTCKVVSLRPPACVQSLGHVAQPIEATKRFFSCSQCGRKTHALNLLLPNVPCEGCGSMSFKRVGMGSVPVAKLARDELQVRGVYCEK